MRRISATVIATVIATLAFCVGSLSIDAQQPANVPRVGYLAGGSQPAFQHLVDALLRGMRDLGYVEGKDFVLEIRAAEGKLDRLPSIAAELVRDKVAVIFVGAFAPLQAAKEATKTIPIVVAGLDDPVGRGLITSLERPGGNITGVESRSVPQTQRIELLRQVVPTLSRLAVLANPRDADSVRTAQGLETTARAAGIDVRRFEVGTLEGFDDAFAAMAKDGAQAVIVVNDAMFFSARARIVDLAAKVRIPALYGPKEFVEAGGLMSYGLIISDRFRQSAGYVVKILKGANPGELAVEGPTGKGVLALNVKAAKALGLMVPQSLLSQADTVVE